MCLADDGPSQAEKYRKILKHREDRILAANRNRLPTRTPSQRLGSEASEIISFEHVNINGINSHDNFVELSNTMGIIETMETGVFSVVETQWDTTCPKFYTMIKQKIKAKDTYAKVSFASNLDEEYLTSWKPGGTLIGASERWASRVNKSGNNKLGRWSWLDMRVEKGRMIRVISAYRVL